MATGGLAKWVGAVQAFGHPSWSYVIKLRHSHVTVIERGFYELCGGENWNMLHELPGDNGLLEMWESRESMLESWSPGDGHSWAMAWAGWRAARETMQRRQYVNEPTFSCWSQSELGENGWHVHIIIGGPGLTRQNAAISRSILCTSFFKHLLITIRQRTHAPDIVLSRDELNAWNWLQKIAQRVMRGDMEDIVDILKCRKANGTLVAQAINGTEFITRYMLPKNRKVADTVSTRHTTPEQSYNSTWGKTYGFAVCNGETVSEFTRKDLWKVLYNIYTAHPAENMLNSNPSVWGDLPRVSANRIDADDAEARSRPIKLSRKQKIMAEVIQRATDGLLLTYNDLVVHLSDLMLMLEGMPGGSKTAEQLLTMIHIKLCAKYNAYEFMLMKTPATQNMNPGAPHYDCQGNLVFKLLNLQGYNPWQVGHWLVMMLSKKTGKRNSTLFYGPASTGKTNLAKAICHAVGLYGCVNHNNKQFPFNDAPNKMILWWEECIMTTDYVEAAKCVLGGTHVRVDVKHKDSRELPQIPVLLSSNHDVYTVVGGNATFGVHAAPLKERITQMNFMKQLPNTFGEITPGMISNWLSHCAHIHQEHLSLEGFAIKWNVQSVGNSFPLQTLCPGHSQNWTFSENGVCWHCGGFIQPTPESDTDSDGDPDPDGAVAGDSDTSANSESTVSFSSNDSGLGSVTSSAPSVPDRAEELEEIPSECLEWMREEVDRLSAHDINSLAHQATGFILDPIPEEPEEGEQNLAREDTEPEASTSHTPATKRARVEEGEPWDGTQPITEGDWIDFESRQKRRRLEREEKGGEDEDMEVQESDPSAWGEKLGVVEKPGEEPIVLYCFETLPESDEEGDSDKENQTHAI